MVVNGSQNRAAFPAFCGANAALPALSFNCLQASDSLSNFVGYNTISLKGDQMNLLCANWDGVGSASGEASLKDILQGAGKLTSYDEGYFTPGDYINTWNLEVGDWGETYFYADQPVAWGSEYSDCWIIQDEYPIVDPVMMRPGTAFWLYHSGTNIDAINFAGQVASGTHGYTLKGGQMNLCGNPYPTVLNLAESAGQVTITGATSYDDAYFTPGDYISTWMLTAGDWGETYFYADQPVAWGEEYTKCWIIADEYPIIADTAIQPGCGFWYYAVNPGVTLTFTQVK